MADEQTEEAHGEGTNGVSVSSFADARAAFLAGEDEKPAAPKAKATSSEVEDDDSDLDEGESADEDADKSDDVDEQDPDADLDDEDDKPAADKDDEKPDADTAKRLSQVQRTEKRMREQLKKERAAMESEVETKAREYKARVDAEIEKWKPRVEAVEKFERLKGRADIVGLLKAAEFPEEAYAHAGQILYTLSQAKGDDEKAQKARLAVASLTKDRERDDELAELKKWRAESEKTAKEREEAAAADAQWNEFFTKVEKSVGDKTPLAKALLKSNPTKARERITIATERFIRSNSRYPSEREIAIAVEKDRRQALRDMGIDPKSLSAAKATAAIEAKTTTTTKKNDSKKTDKPSEKSDDKALSPREAFLRGVKYD